MTRSGMTVRMVDPVADDVLVDTITRGLKPRADSESLSEAEVG